MAFTITTKGKNLFGACNMDYAVGSAVSLSYTGQPTVTADKIVFNLPGHNYAGNLAECYRKTLALEPNVTYTLSFVLSDSALVTISIYDVSKTIATIIATIYVSTTNASSPITFTPESGTVYVYIQNTDSSPRIFSISSIHLQKASQPSQSATVNDELFGFEGVYDTIESDGTVTKYWSRTTKTTDGSGNFTLSGYATGSNLIVVNNTNGETKILPASGTVATGWASVSVTVIYRLATPITGATFTGTVDLMPGENNIIVPKFGIISVKGRSKYLQG